MKTTTAFVADDGTKFESAEECKAYEAEAVLDTLVGLTAEDVRDAVAYRNKDLARSIESVAARCFAARSAAGDVVSRGRKKAEAAETQPDASEQATGENVATLPRSRKRAA